MCGRPSFVRRAGADKRQAVDVMPGQPAHKVGGGCFRRKMVMLLKFTSPSPS